MMIRISAILAALFLLPAVAVHAADCPAWQTTVLPTDHPSMAISVDSLLERLPSEPFATSPEYVADATRTLDEARDLLVQARQPMPLGDITGTWRVASIQLGSSGAFGYPYFTGRIQRDACGYHFAKATGSQRRTGELLPMEDDRTLAFPRHVHRQRWTHGTLRPRQPQPGLARRARGPHQLCRSTGAPWPRHLADDSRRPRQRQHVRALSAAALKPPDRCAAQLQRPARHSGNSPTSGAQTSAHPGSAISRTRGGQKTIISPAWGLPPITKVDPAPSFRARLTAVVGRVTRRTL